MGHGSWRGDQRQHALPGHYEIFLRIKDLQRSVYLLDQ